MGIWDMGLSAPGGPEWPSEANSGQNGSNWPKLAIWAEITEIGHLGQFPT